MFPIYPISFSQDDEDDGSNLPLGLRLAMMGRKQTAASMPPSDIATDDLQRQNSSSSASDPGSPWAFRSSIGQQIVDMPRLHSRIAQPNITAPTPDLRSTNPTQRMPMLDTSPSDQVNATEPKSNLGNRIMEIGQQKAAAHIPQRSDMEVPVPSFAWPDQQRQQQVLNDLVTGIPASTPLQGPPWPEGAQDSEQFFGGKPRFRSNIAVGHDQPSSSPAPKENIDKRSFLLDVSSEKLPLFRFKPIIDEGGKQHQIGEVPLRDSLSREFRDFHMLTDDSRGIADQRTASSSRPRPAVLEMQGLAKVTVPLAPDRNIQKYLSYIVDGLRTTQFNDLSYSELLPYVMATINAESSRFEPISELGNPDPYKGRGFIQLTHQAGYADMGRKLNIDLVNNPMLANDPQVAARVLAQYMKDNALRITNDLRSGGDPRDAIDLLRKYLDDVNDSHPEYRQRLADNGLVKSRVVVNGRDKKTLLPNGLEAFLPALRFGQDYIRIVRAAAEQPAFTLADAARIWTDGDSSADRETYITEVEKQLRVGRKSKLSDLTFQQQQTLTNIQADYARSMIKDLQDRAARKAEMSQ